MVFTVNVGVSTVAPLREKACREAVVSRLSLSCLLPFEAVLRVVIRRLRVLLGGCVVWD